MSHDAPINDSVLDEIHEEGEYLTQSEGELPAAGKVEVEASADSPVAGDQDLPSLADYDMEIKTDVDNVKRVHQLEEVAKVVLAQETISQGDAEEIEQKVGGLYDNVGPAASFSEVPTSVNLSATKHYLTQQLEGQRSALQAHHEAYFEKTLAAVTAKKESLLTEIREAIIPELENLKVSASEDMAAAAGSSKFLAYEVVKAESNSQPRLVDLKHLCLYDGDIAERFQLKHSDLPTSDDIRRFREVAGSQGFVEILKAGQASGELYNVLHLQAHGWSGSEKDISCLTNTYMKSLALLSSGVLIDFFAKSADQLLSGELNNLPETSGDLTVEEISKRALWLSDYYEVLLHLEKKVMLTKMYCYRVKVILDGFGKMLHA